MNKYHNSFSEKEFYKQWYDLLAKYLTEQKYLECVLGVCYVVTLTLLWVKL